ncbi:MAG: hypothetical protein Q9218_006910 [Villophora microphyllina]
MEPTVAGTNRSHSVGHDIGPQRNGATYTTDPTITQVSMDWFPWPTGPLTLEDRIPPRILEAARNHAPMVVFAWSDPPNDQLPTAHVEGISWYQGPRRQWIAFDLHNGRVRPDIHPTLGPIPEPRPLGFPAMNPPFHLFVRHCIAPVDRNPHVQWHQVGNFFRAWRNAEMRYDDDVQPDLDMTLINRLQARRRTLAAERDARAAQNPATNGHYIDLTHESDSPAQPGNPQGQDSHRLGGSTRTQATTSVREDGSMPPPVIPHHSAHSQEHRLSGTTSIGRPSNPIRNPHGRLQELPPAYPPRSSTATLREGVMSEGRDTPRLLSTQRRIQNNTVRPSLPNSDSRRIEALIRRQRAIRAADALNSNELNNQEPLSTQPRSRTANVPPSVSHIDDLLIRTRQRDQASHAADPQDSTNRHAEVRTTSSQDLGPPHPGITTVREREAQRKREAEEREGQLRREASERRREELLRQKEGLERRIEEANKRQRTESPE